MRINRVIIPKITQPKMVDVLPRECLFELIDVGFKKSIVWINSPAGYGKTTLIASYIEDRKFPCLWYQIDKGDNEIAEFFHYMGLAIKKSAPKRKITLPLLTPESLQNISNFAKRYFENLFTYIKAPFVIVFDNYHEVSENSLVQEVISQGLCMLPDGINVMFGSRAYPPPTLVNLIATSKIELIGREQLCFKVDESKKVIKLNYKANISPKKLKEIHDITHGWAAGLILILCRANSLHIDSNLSDMSSLTDIFNYFANEIFKSLDKPSKDFLLKTAFFPHMTIQMAKDLTENKQAAQIFSQLYSKNCFIEKRFDSKLVYQFHPLFREFLLNLVKKEFSPYEILQLKYKAATLLEESGQNEYAAEIYCKIGSWDNLLQLIQKQANSLIHQGRNKILTYWIKDVPLKIFKNSSWLNYWMGISLLPFDQNDAREYLKKAFKIFKNEKNYDGLFLSISNIVDSLILEQSDIASLGLWIKEIQNLLIKNRTFSSRKIEIQVALTMLRALLFYQPEFHANSSISEWAKKVEKLMQDIDDPDQLIKISNSLIVYYCYAGELRKAFLILEKIKISHNCKRFSPLNSIIWILMEALYYHFSGHFQICQQLLEKGIERSKKFKIHIYIPNLLAIGVFSSLALQDLISAEKYLKRMILTINNNKLNIYKGEYYYMVSWYKWLTNDLIQSFEYMERSFTYAVESGKTIGLFINNIAISQLLTEKGKYHEAANHLDKFQKSIKESDYHYIYYKWLLAKARLELIQNKEKEGLDYLQKAMLFSREKEIFYIDFFHPTIMSTLCIIALKAQIEVEHVQKIINKLNLFPEIQPFDCKLWPWPIKIFTMGKFLVVKDNKRLDFNHKVQKKPIQLLKTIISLGIENTNEAKLCDILWPDSDRDMVHRVFSTSLNRLRKLLGNDKILQLADGNLSLNINYCWIDVFIFEQKLKQSDIAYMEGHVDKAINLIKEALVLYHGHFLPNDDSESQTILYRDKLRSKFIHYTNRLGYYYKEAGELNEAIECFTKGIEVDCLAEDFYQQLMVCFNKIGQKAKSVSIYNSCKNILSKVHGIKPSQKTEYIYLSIIMDDL